MQKTVNVLGRSFRVHGDPRDRYFREAVPHGGSFADTPIVIASHYCRSDATIADVGANIGLTAMAFAQISPHGRVLAIEPSSKNFDLLRQNIEANRLMNVEPLNIALSNHAGVVQLFEDPGFMAGARVLSPSLESHVKSAPVTATTLDSELSRLGIERLDFIKIDVEGHERQVLEGAKLTLERLRPMCVIEFNSYTMVYHLGLRPKEFLDYLFHIFPNVYHFDRLNYELLDLAGRGDELLKINERNGFVDDLVCVFEPLSAVRR